MVTHKNPDKPSPQVMADSTAVQKSGKTIQLILPLIVLLGLLLVWYLVTFANLFPALHDAGKLWQIGKTHSCMKLRILAVDTNGIIIIPDMSKTPGKV